jgi:hypothetical protein
MPITTAKVSFVAGEVSPALWARSDLGKYAGGAATMRNGFPSVRGGYYSRAGTKFCGQAKQVASAASVPPRLLPFQFQIGQAYVIEFGDRYARFIANGAYITETPLAIVSATRANPCVLGVPGNNFNAGDWVAVIGVGGMFELNNRAFQVLSASGSTIALGDTFGNPVNSLGFPAYTTSGTVARIYTIATPYAASDLPYLKWTESADLMSLCLVNTPALTEYATQDLSRLAANSWTINPTSFATSISAPAACSGVFSGATGSTTNYAYCVTAVDAITGQESQASPIANFQGAGDIGITAGSNTITWSAVAGAGSYNVYKANPVVGAAAVPIGTAFGFVGQAFGRQFVDANVVADMTITPPLHLNPFSSGQVLSVNMTAAGTGYAQGTATASIATSTGSGAVLVPVVVGGTISAVIVQNPGANYQSGDTLVIGGPGSGAAGTLSIGPQSGTNPGVVAYFQQRRIYADTLNNPDTYFASKTGAFTNMDAGNPPIDDDAITGNPWAQQVNGIQWLVPLQTGLMVATGLDVWLLEGTGGPYSAVTPSSEQAIPQESQGFSPTVPPIKVGQQVLFVQALGFIVRALNYNYFTNTYSGEELTVLANHLFDGHQIVQWAWAREPNKIVWCVRDDGVLLSLTYLKEQEVVAWARHDTNGQVVSIAVASEPPVDAVYVVVKRWIAGKQAWGYYVERFDNRLWFNAEQCWCVDAGLALSLTTPSAALSASAASGAGVTFSASQAVFDGVTLGIAGQVIRIGGGKATVTQYLSPTQVIGNITLPITATVPNDPNNLPVPAAAGAWSIATPVTSVAGLDHLEGMQVTGLADGAVIPPTTVSGGAITLPQAATAVVVGLGFQAQLQTLPLEIREAGVVAGKRKKTAGVTVRVERSRGIKAGVDQVNASELENFATQPWGAYPFGKLNKLKQTQSLLGSGSYLPLETCDVFVPVDGDWNKPGWSAAPGMVAFQQDDPLPMNILGVYPETTVGDTYTRMDK